MQKNTLNTTKSYQNSYYKTNIIIKITDIVKVGGINYMIDDINGNSLTGTDMYGNEKSFFFDDIQSIRFHSNQQKNIYDFLKLNEKQLLENTLKDINEKLNNSKLSLSKTNNLKKLKKSTLKKLNNLGADLSANQKSNSLFEQTA
ncbi:hypothetical protein [Halarcobacter sp.]|uniref:hypothetical protein n=1 Tax=Halarcobacter sp. TaxID=2321133 RepID=UPI003A95023C